MRVFAGNLIEFQQCVINQNVVIAVFLTEILFYIHNSQRARPHGRPIHVRLFWVLQLVDNRRYQSCHLHVN